MYWKRQNNYNRWDRTTGVPSGIHLTRQSVQYSPSITRKRSSPCGVSCNTKKYDCLFKLSNSDGPRLTSCLLASRRHRNTPAFQQFCRQLYRACLARIFAPLKAGMTTPEVVRCPDGYFRRVIYGLGPYIADYREQVWLTGTAQGWCPKYVFPIVLVQMSS
jgi:Plavaka transposase